MRAAVLTLNRGSIFLIPRVLESEVRTSSGASGGLGAPLSSLQQMSGSAGCEMAAVIAPRPRGLQPIHSPVSSLIEPEEIGDDPTVTRPYRHHHTVKGTVQTKYEKARNKFRLRFFIAANSVCGSSYVS